MDKPPKAAKNRHAPPHPSQMLMKPQSQACKCERSRSGTGSTGSRLHCLSCQGMLTPGRIPIVPKLQCWISAELRAHSGAYCQTGEGTAEASSTPDPHLPRVAVQTHQNPQVLRMQLCSPAAQWRVYRGNLRVKVGLFTEDNSI